MAVRLLILCGSAWLTAACAGQSRTDDGDGGIDQGADSGGIEQGADSGGPPTIEGCLAGSELPDLTCEPEGSLEQWWVSADSPLYPCSGMSNHNAPTMQFLFSVENMEELQVVSLRIGPRGQPAADEYALELFLTPPRPVDEIGTELSGRLRVEDRTFGAGFAFIDADVSVATVTFDAAPTLSGLTDGQLLRGTYEWSGGDYVMLVEGEPADVADPNAAARGCFNLVATIEPHQTL